MTQVNLCFDESCVWKDDRRYSEWRQTENGKKVYEEAKKVVLKLESKGLKAGIRDVFSYVRVNFWIDKGFEKYKVNNNFSRLAAYEMESELPELIGYFEHRN